MRCTKSPAFRARLLPYSSDKSAPKQAITPEFEKTYKEWKAERITATEAMQRLDMKPNTFYRRVKEYEK
ncbi:hypothetical protein HQN89_27510 [Paenibacillus frigoriresistens]|nr:hypothetical protein [Paenibacillus frigoriresistens]